MNRFIFWQRWLLAVSILIVIFGLALAVASGTAAIDPFNRMVDPVFWGGQPVPPHAAAFRETLGWVLHLQGEDRRALPLLRKAVTGLPNSIEAHAHLGLVEAATGGDQLARWHLAAAVGIAERLKNSGEEINLEQETALKLARQTLSNLESQEGER